MAQNKYPIIRINKLANKRADEIVKAFEAQGIEVSKSSLVSELILSMPLPQPATPAVEKKSRHKTQRQTVTVAAL